MMSNDLRALRGPEDISDPFSPLFVDHVNTSLTDIAPEEWVFVKGEDSPRGKPLLIAPQPTTIFEIEKFK